MGSVGNDASAAATQPYFPGSATIAGYTILSPIPEPGAQADVYVARDDDNQRYAVKLYRGLTTPLLIPRCLLSPTAPCFTRRQRL
jgi:hypothetical protein